MLRKSPPLCGPPQSRRFLATQDYAVPKSCCKETVEAEFGPSANRTSADRHEKVCDGIL